MTVITISRQYGSGGDEIACQVCETLDYQYFDKRLLQQMISQEHLTPEQLGDYHEDAYHMRTFLDRLRGYRPCPALEPPKERASFVRARDATEQIGENMLIWLADAAIRASYETGKIVIVGRGGQAVLHDKPGVLHVRIEAPLALRVERVAESQNMSPPVARQAVTKHDNGAADYLKHFYGVNWADPMLYHLVINTGRVSLDAAARLIMDAARYLEQAQSQAPQGVIAASGG